MMMMFVFDTKVHHALRDVRSSILQSCVGCVAVRRPTVRV
jgi:hypothetical protein